MNKSYGIIMSKPMVLAYLDNKKYMTRRTKGLNEINKNPDEWEFKGIFEWGAIFSSRYHIGKNMNITLPYGRAEQDTLYFKETYQIGEGITSKSATSIYYKADTAFDIKKWKSSMFMPRAYSRFQNIPITNVRVERLQDITNNDALAEGTPDLRTIENNWDLRQCYFYLWDSLNAKRGHPVSRNDWVWVYEFPRYK